MMKKQAGFTLAELLIAMVILGIIASFFIPQVLNAVGQQGNISKIKDTVALIEQSLYNCTLDSSCASPAIGEDFHRIFVNPATNTTVSKWKNLSNSAAAFDDTLIGMPANTHPCDAGTTGTIYNAASGTGWVLLTSGQLIVGLDSAPMRAATVAARTFSFCLDANGAGGPNVPGQDIRLGNFALERQVVDNTATAGNPTATDFAWGNPNGTVSAATLATGGALTGVCAPAGGTNCDAATALGR